MEDVQTGDVLRSEGLLLSISPVTCQAVVVDLEDAKVGDIHGERVGQGPRHVAVLSVDGVQLGHAAVAAPTLEASLHPLALLAAGSSLNL